MQKTAKINGFCPYFDENITIRATFKNYSVLGAIPYATPQENLCKYRSECGRSAEPSECLIFDQSFRWNDL